MSEYQGLIDDFVSKAEKASAEGLKQYPQTTFDEVEREVENEDGETDTVTEMVARTVMVDIDIDPEDEEKLLESNHAQIQSIVEILQGLLEDEDAVEELKAHFGELDVDGSGELSMEEARPFCVEMIKEQCEEYGADEPPEEVLASMVEDSFKSMDVDSDGMLTEAEFVFGLALQKATIEAPMADPMYCLCIDDDGHATVFDVRDPPDDATVAGAPAEAVDDSNDAEAAAIAAKTEAVKASTTGPASAAAKPAAKPAAAKPAAKPAAEKPAAEKPAAKPAAESGDKPAAKKNAAKTGKKKKKSGCCQQ